MAANVLIAEHFGLIKVDIMKKIAIVGVGASGEFVRFTIEAARLATESNNGIIVTGTDVSFEMAPEEVRQKLMDVAKSNAKLTLYKSEVYPLLAQERLYYDYPVSLKTKNKPFYYGVPKSKKRGRKK